MPPRIVLRSIYNLYNHTRTSFLVSSVTMSLSRSYLSILACHQRIIINYTFSYLHVDR